MLITDVTEPASTSTNGAAEQKPPGNTAEPGADVELRSQILERVVAHTSVAPPLPKWPFPVHEDFRQVRDFPDVLRGRLLKEFTEQELVSARIFQRGSNGVTLSPVFGDANSRFVVHYKADKPVDASSSRGILSTSAPAWLRYALARRTDGEKRYDIYLAFSEEDALVFSWLERGFVFAGPLDHLMGKHVRLLSECARGKEPPAYSLIVPAWSIAKLTPTAPGVVVETLERFAKCPRHFNFDLAEIIKVSIVDAADCSDLNDARSFQDLETFRNAFKRCREKPLVQIDKALERIREQDCAGYTAARRKVSRAISDSNVAPLVAETTAALADLKTEFEKSHCEPIEALGHEHMHPTERNRAVFAADLSKSWFNLLDEVCDARQIIAGERPDQADAAARLDRRIRIAKTFLQLAPRHDKFYPLP